ncbi:transposase zinc-binding domain-containing protein, partial [Carboxylicivirga sediminis]
MKPRHEVADVLNQHLDRIEQLCTNSWQARALYALAACRTAKLGGHIDRCDNPNCQALHLSYNSCRNRHCPKCQGHKREEWVRQREADL